MFTDVIILKRRKKNLSSCKTILYDQKIEDRDTESKGFYSRKRYI